MSGSKQNAKPRDVIYETTVRNDLCGPAAVENGLEQLPPVPQRNTLVAHSSCDATDIYQPGWNPSRSTVSGVSPPWLAARRCCRAATGQTGRGNAGGFAPFLSGGSLLSVCLSPFTINLATGESLLWLQLSVLVFVSSYPRHPLHHLHTHARTHTRTHTHWVLSAQHG